MRKAMKTLTISVGLCLALVLSASTFAQTPQSPNRPDSQSQATPSQTAPPAQNAPEGQGAPATPSAPATQGAPSSAPQTAAPSNGNQGSAQQGENKGVDIDKELGLTEDQKQKIATLVDDENRQIAAVRDDNSMSLEQKQQKVLQIRQAGTPKIKAILTPEQLQKLAALQQRMRDEQNAAQPSSPSGTQSAPQTPPQH
jgi:Spy/CpxP family protein refolding chaperone